MIEPMTVEPMTVEHAIAGLALGLLAACGAIAWLAVRVRAVDASLTAVKRRRGWWGPPNEVAVERCNRCGACAQRGASEASP